MWQRPKPHGCNFFKSFSFARCKERVLYLSFLARYLGSIVAKDLVVSLWIARPEFSDRPKKKKKKLFFQQVSGMYCHPLCKFSISIEALKLKNFFRLRSFFSFLLLDITFTVQRLIQYWGAFLTFDAFTENFFWRVRGMRSERSVRSPLLQYRSCFFLSGSHYCVFTRKTSVDA